MSSPPESKWLVICHGQTTDLNLSEIKAGPSVDSVDLHGSTIWLGTSNPEDVLDWIASKPWGQTHQVVTNQDAELVVSELMGRLAIEDSFPEPRIKRSDLSYQMRFQPIVDLKTTQTIGYEALMRADAPGGAFSADALIAKATKEGWLEDLDRLGRELALEAVGPWLGEGLLFLNMMAPDGVFDLSATRACVLAAQDKGLEADQIVFETTERNKYHNIETAAAQLAKLKEMGARLAIDDLGEGYSSLLVATSFKPDILKISGELTAQLPSNEALAAIEAIATLGHGAGMWIVAEKVETAEHASLLRELDIDWAQGHFFGAPKVMG